jgi:hypothetical protein
MVDSEMTTTQPRSAVDGPPAVDWYRLSADEVMGRLETAPVAGLTETEARERLKRFAVEVW